MLFITHLISALLLNSLYLGFANAQEGDAQAPLDGSGMVDAVEHALVTTPLPVFDKAHWIWTADGAEHNAVAGTRAFRKTWSPPQGKTPVKTDVLFVSDSRATLYVNGQEVTTSTRWSSSGRHCVQLEQCHNVFAVKAAVIPGFAGTRPTDPRVGSAGVLAVFQMTYSDGSISLVTTDSSWRSNPDPPAGFEALSYDDGVDGWEPSTDLGVYGTYWPKATIVDPTESPSFNGASFMWSGDLVDGRTTLLDRTFRKNITLPAGSDKAILDIMLTADDEYSLYVNGDAIGSGTSWRNAQRFVLRDVPGPNILLAIHAANTVQNSYAGVLLSAIVTTEHTAVNQCQSSTFYHSGEDWKVQPSFEQLGFSETEWPHAVVGKPYTELASEITLASSISDRSAPLPGAPLGNRG